MQRFNRFFRIKMGLDLYCNGISEKCGSYSSVQKIRYLLLVGLKFYLETEHGQEDDAIDYIISLLGIQNEILYRNFSEKSNSVLRKLNIYGFFPFIFHSDCDGSLSSYDAKQFMKTWNITKDYMEEELKDFDGNFYLQSIFEESIDSCEEIRFC